MEGFEPTFATPITIIEFVSQLGYTRIGDCFFEKVETTKQSRILKVPPLGFEPRTPTLKV